METLVSWERVKNPSAFPAIYGFCRGLFQGLIFLIKNKF
jgi:hypothetical protein